MEEPAGACGASPREGLGRERSEDGVAYPARAGCASCSNGCGARAADEAAPACPAGDQVFTDGGSGAAPGSAPHEAPARPGAGAHALCDTPYDLLVGADLVYTQAAIAPLARTIARVLCGRGLRPPTGRVLLAHKDRHADVTAGLMAALAEAGLALEPVGVSVRSPAVRVYRGQWMRTV